MSTNGGPIRAYERLDERLFLAWQRGDEDAREASWRLMWGLAYARARRACRHFARDRFSADHDAASSVTDAWVEIDRTVATREWNGEDEFRGLLIARVILRCRDRRREFVRAVARVDDLIGIADEDREARVAALAQAANTPGAPISAEALDTFLRRLGMLREWARARPALVATVEAIVSYVRDSLLAALPPGVDGEGMSVDDLAARADLRGLSLRRSEMSTSVMKRLGGSRNTFDQRMRQIRKLCADQSRPRRRGRGQTVSLQ